MGRSIWMARGAYVGSGVGIDKADNAVQEVSVNNMDTTVGKVMARFMTRQHSAAPCLGMGEMNEMHDTPGRPR